MLLFRIKKEYEHENPIYYHIDKVNVDEVQGDMVKVHDINDGVEFWIAKSKLEIA